jgi:hypothetical protein
MKKLSLLLFCLPFFACNSEKISPAALENLKREIMPASLNNELFKKIATVPQEFSVDTKKDTSLTCKNGTVVSIPQNCFLDENGDAVSGDVKIKVVEALSMSDFLKNNLQTYSDGKLLESAGMIYIDASANNKPLLLKDSSSLHIEMPTDFKGPDYKIFTGKYDSAGNMNWSESGTIDEGMVPLPLSVFNYRYYTKYKFKESSPIIYLDSIEFQKNSKYENTWVATEEFEGRFWWMSILSYQYYGEYNYHRLWKVDTSKTEYGKEYEITHPLIDIYLSNTAKPLWYADSLCWVLTRSNEIKDSIEYCKTEKWSKLMNSGFGWEGSGVFYNFYKEHLTFALKYDPRGVDMKLSNAKDLLMNKGLGEKEAYQQVLIYKSRQKIIEARNNRKQIADEKKKGQGAVTKAFKVAFDAQQLGWYNVDHFLSDPSAKEVELFVDIKDDGLDYCDLSLILPGRNAAINAVPEGKGRYNFSCKKGGKSTLPVGDNAILIAMSTKKGIPYFVQRPIKITESQHFEMQLEKSSWKNVDSTLQTLFRPPNG